MFVRRAAELRGQPEQEVGRRVAGPLRRVAGEREVAVRPVHERDEHVLPLHFAAELERMPAANPGEVVGDVEHLVQALDERLLHVAEAEEAGDAAMLARPRAVVDVLRHVDAVGGVLEPAGPLRAGGDPVVRDARPG